MEESGGRKGPRSERLFYFTCPGCGQQAASPALGLLRLWMRTHDLVRCLWRQADQLGQRARRSALRN